MLTTFECPKCRNTGFPGFTMGNDARMVVCCNKCGYEAPHLGPADFSQGLATTEAAAGDVRGWAGRAVVVVDTSGRAPEVAMRTAPAPIVQPAGHMHPGHPAPIVQPLQPGDVIGWIESRAQWLAAEDAKLEGQVAECKARLAGIRAEARRLNKMLTAGKGARAEVHEHTVRSNHVDGAAMKN
jgi:hypothetical protein